MQWEGFMDPRLEVTQKIKVGKYQCSGTSGLPEVRYECP